MVNKLLQNHGIYRPADIQISVGNASLGTLLEGQPYGTYLLPVFAGFDPVSGHEMFYEVNQDLINTQGIYQFTGNLLDGTRNPALVSPNSMLITDKTSQPKLFGGFGNTIKFAGFDLYGFFYFQYGNWIYDADEVKQSYVLAAGGQMRKTTMDNPYLIYDQSALASTRFLHDGSFIRLRDLQLGYTLPKSLVSKLKISTVRIYVSGQNLMTITKYKGWDPEVYGGSNNNNALPSVTQNSFPQATTYMAGIRIGF